MALRYAYHPGNVAHSNAIEVADTMPAAAESLGIELVDLDGATSCGAGIIRQANADLQVVLNARTMAQAEALGLDIITPCATTAATLHEDLTSLRNDSKLMAKTNDILERNYKLIKCIKTTHFGPEDSHMGDYVHFYQKI